MQDLIKLADYPVRYVLKELLRDKTTGKNIIYATDAYKEKYPLLDKYTRMTRQQLLGFTDPLLIQPRVYKSAEEQTKRTRKKAEVFTPSWVINKMVNYLDAQWFGRDITGRNACDGVFNTETERGWTPNPSPIQFEKADGWKKYVDSRRLEITCGEAPYLVSRYDADTGETIPIEARIGILDRKLRVVNENTHTEEEWLTWTRRAFESVYGYEFQGDNLLIARINLLLTFVEYMELRWERRPTESELKEIANIIVWNIWQMDGMSGTVPYEKNRYFFKQLALVVSGPLDFMESKKREPLESEESFTCKIYDWRSRVPIRFNDLKDRERLKLSMKFDFIIGNPPYQEEQISNNPDGALKNYAPPVYDKFMDASYEAANSVELIHPARFLFNAGSTPKEWNQKMLADEHFKVLFYEEDGSAVFPSLSTPLRGGVAITYRDSTKVFGAIQAFNKFPEANAILHKVINDNSFKTLMDIVYSRTSYRLTDLMHSENPFAISRLSKGHAYDMSSNIMSLIPEIFLDKKPSDGKDYIQILGRTDNKRVYKYIRRDYVKHVDNLDSYKVYVAQANGSGEFGETMSEPVVEKPGVGSTETFLSIGKLDTIEEALTLKKYIKTKFARTLLSILKVTQNGNKPVWKFIPLQDFTSQSDIDWSKSISDIDRQLYAKYGLSDDEIAFIESHVKEME